MIVKRIFIILTITLVSCKISKSNLAISNSSKWNQESLNQKALDNLDTLKWDKKLLYQDIETYQKYIENFKSFPLYKSPFPVSEYDYAVSSIPFIIENNGAIYKGIRIGEYENPESEKIIDKVFLIIQTNDKNSEENSLVESRNFPYLTAQGTFKTNSNEYDWVFSASPDGFSTLLVNMKLFDIRFGETIIIYPQKDQSFFYDQIKDSPNNYSSFDSFKSVLITKMKKY